MSVSQAALRLGVSPARIRQRVDDGSLVAEKIGGRWLIDLDASPSVSAPVGRPVSSRSVWASIAAVQPDFFYGDLHVDAAPLSRSSRDRAIRRLKGAVEERDGDALFAWLANRAERLLYVAAPSDAEKLRSDSRIVLSGVSDPRSLLEDPRILEGYVQVDRVEEVVSEYWLEKPVVGDRPNVVLHVAPIRPSSISPMLLAADLHEHGGPRERFRASELIAEWIDAMQRRAVVESSE